MRTGNEYRRFEIVNLRGPCSASKAGALAGVSKLNEIPLIVWLRHLLGLSVKIILAPEADIGFTGARVKRGK